MKITNKDASHPILQRKFTSFTRRRAFSLIELLIVITIIGILAVAFLPSITSGPSRARDTQRIADMSDIALALELYYQDTGSFPLVTGAIHDASEPGLSLKTYFDNNTIPLDPSGRTYGTTTTLGRYYYKSCQSNQGYVIVANPENAKTTTNYFDHSTESTLCSANSLTGPTTTSADTNFYILYKNRN
ncbi:MAG: prepilin-type N-terminal cleavage/methylation domain-containing protein [Candidatus Peregrinibacteria bacterium]|nr:prepilin-type N-terminal cleavage/methylation domain-containing protein [Candidatus Peregrinibacteria bacterium]MDZ4244291.1 prepilin-type N-terminal cleavage/methylation domain-containing protein [Candidatus Gracilibacteria bacterium]